MKSSFVDSDRVRDHALGALLGMSVGDALGGPVEFMSRVEIRQKYGVLQKMVGGGWLYLKPGQVTDDTEMSFCVARALVEAGGMEGEIVAKHFARWLRAGPIDVGNACARGIRRYLMKGTVAANPSLMAAGNGALMRMAPVAVATALCPELLEPWSLVQAHVTHNNPLSDAACVAAGAMVHMGIRGGGMLALLDIPRKLAASHPQFGYHPYPGKATGYVPDTLATAIHGFRVTDNFEDCLVEVVNLGGDADTTGAVAGMIAGGWYGASAIPRRWLRKLDKRVVQGWEALVDPLLKLGAAAGQEGAAAPGGVDAEHG